MSFGTVKAPNGYDYTNVLYDLYKNIGVLNNNVTSVDITSEAFRAGTTILSFQYDLNTLQSGYTSFDTAPGILSLSLKFAGPTQSDLSVFCFQLINSNVYYHSNGVVVATS